MLVFPDPLLPISNTCKVDIVRIKEHTWNGETELSVKERNLWTTKMLFLFPVMLDSTKLICQPFSSS